VLLETVRHSRFAPDSEDFRSLRLLCSPSVQVVNIERASSWIPCRRACRPLHDKTVTAKQLPLKTERRLSG
jgi:hypothetical protein